MNYIGEHPLNLLGKLAIVTSASSLTGAAVARELLNSNALVLGVDTSPPHPSTQSARGSHFQFYQYQYGDCGKVSFKGSIVQEAERVFGRQGVDLLVVVQNGTGVEHMGEVLDVMRKQGQGVVVNVSVVGEAGEEEKVVKETKALSEELKGKGVVCNAVVHRDVGKGSDDLAASTRDLLQDHVDAHNSRR